MTMKHSVQYAGPTGVRVPCRMKLELVESMTCRGIVKYFRRQILNSHLGFNLSIICSSVVQINASCLHSI